MFQLDTKQLERFHGTVKKFAEVQAKSVGLVFRDEVRLLLDRITLGGEGRVVTPPESLRQGEKRVQTDIRKSVQPMNWMYYKEGTRVTKWLKRYANSKTPQAIIKMARDGALGQGFRSLIFVNAAQFPAVHQESRDDRGRVRRKNKGMATLDKDGQKEYIELRQKKVGQAKGGWAAAIAALGGTTPEYVGRHQAAGTVQEDWKDLNWFLAAFNRSEWSKRNDSQRIVDQAVEGRIPAIEAKIQRTLDENARKL